MEWGSEKWSGGMKNGVGKGVMLVDVQRTVRTPR